MGRTHMTHSEYLTCAREALLSRADAVADLEKLPGGIYLFGHNHLQFYLEYGDKLFINPGSCGEALDWDATAAYTLLDLTPGGRIVTERRVPYNLKNVSDGLRDSGFKAYAPVWSDVLERELLTGKGYFDLFLHHLIKTGQELGKTDYPVGNDVWDAAARSWEPDKLWKEWVLG